MDVSHLWQWANSSLRRCPQTSPFILRSLLSHISSLLPPSRAVSQQRRAAVLSPDPSFPRRWIWGKAEPSFNKGSPRQNRGKGVIFTLCLYPSLLMRNCSQGKACDEPLWTPTEPELFPLDSRMTDEKVLLLSLAGHSLLIVWFGRMQLEATFFLEENFLLLRPPFSTKSFCNGAAPGASASPGALLRLPLHGYTSSEGTKGTSMTCQGSLLWCLVQRQHLHVLDWEAGGNKGSSGTTVAISGAKADGAHVNDPHSLQVLTRCILG